MGPSGSLAIFWGHSAFLLCLEKVVTLLCLCCADKWQTAGLKARLDNCSKIMGAEAKGHLSAAAELSRVIAGPVPGPAPVSHVLA